MLLIEVVVATAILKLGSVGIVIPVLFITEELVDQAAQEEPVELAEPVV